MHILVPLITVLVSAVSATFDYAILARNSFTERSEILTLCSQDVRVIISSASEVTGIEFLRQHVAFYLKPQRIPEEEIDHATRLVQAVQDRSLTYQGTVDTSPRLEGEALRAMTLIYLANDSESTIAGLIRSFSFDDRQDTVASYATDVRPSTYLWKANEHGINDGLYELKQTAAFIVGSEYSHSIPVTVGDQIFSTTDYSVLVHPAYDRRQSSSSPAMPFSAADLFAINSSLDCEIIVGSDRLVVETPKGTVRIVKRGSFEISVSKVKFGYKAVQGRHSLALEVLLNSLENMESLNEAAKYVAVWRDVLDDLFLESGEPRLSFRVPNCTIC